jgi:hypothetical protein
MTKKPALALVRDLPFEEQITQSPERRAILLKELQDAIRAGVLGDALTHAKGPTKVTLPNGTIVTRN